MATHRLVPANKCDVLFVVVAALAVGALAPLVDAAAIAVPAAVAHAEPSGDGGSVPSPPGSPALPGGTSAEGTKNASPPNAGAIGSPGFCGATATPCANPPALRELEQSISRACPGPSSCLPWWPRTGSRPMR
jgi:hypothetical protein